MRKRIKHYKLERTSTNNTTEKMLKHGNLVASIYLQKPSEVAKHYKREDIPDSLFNKWNFKQQQIFLKASKPCAITQEVEKVFRSNKLLAEYA